MKNIFSPLCAAMAAVLLALGCSGCSDSGKATHIGFYISPEGKAGAAGTPDDPFASLHDAMAATRALTTPADTITWWLFGGVHRMTDSVFITPELNQQGQFALRLKAFPGTDPVVSGSVQVKGWTNVIGNLWQARLDKPYRSRQLYVNGRRATRARTEAWPGGFEPVYTGGSGSGIRYGMIDLSDPDKDPKNWKHPERIQAVTHFQWKMMSVPVKAVQAEGPVYDHGLITMQDKAWWSANLYHDSVEVNGKMTTQPGMWSFWRVSFFENSMAFLDTPGEWYLDESEQVLYYMPRPGEDMNTAQVELPVLERMLTCAGSAGTPVQNIILDSVTFEHTTWMQPDGEWGYVSDQSGFFAASPANIVNTTGHVQHVQRTPGAFGFKYTQNVTVQNCTFRHMGAVALDFGTGCKYNTIDHNTFEDISSAAIQLGGVGPEDAHPTLQAMVVEHNTITNNTISYTAQEYVDAAAIFAGFTAHTDISFNHISHTNWSGIAMGWGWGLLDPSGYPGIATAKWYQWGHFDNPTPNSHNRITYNRIEHFIEDRWDGGMIYTTGQQAQGPEDALLIMGNVGFNKNPQGGGNTIYTDGGSRYINVVRNASYNNPIGDMNMGPDVNPFDLVKPRYWTLPVLNGLAYGADCGGCRTYGEITWSGNYWNEGGIPSEEWKIDFDVDILKLFLHGAAIDSLNLYSSNGFFSICPFWDDSTHRSYPTDTTFIGNHVIQGVSDIPASLLDSAGVH